ncbi:MAG: hypothetical protein K8R86_04200, partial [Bacteroidales bacterium]|nr:hypothetical protein [Bacteroidales bacterium]
EVARFTEQVYELFPDKWGDFPLGNGNWMNSDQLQLNGGLLNGQNPYNVYGLWNSQGMVSPYYLNSSYGNYSTTINYGNTSEEKYRGSFKIDVNYKSHNFFAGIEYMQRTERSYSVDPMELWVRMRGLTNFHILQLDMDNPQFGNDTINFYRFYDGQSQQHFDINLRQKLGLPVDGVDFILTDSYDMINNTIDYYDKDGVMHTIYAGENLYTMDMFSVDELLQDGGYVVRYMGYDYLGNKVKGKQGSYDFFTNRTIDAYRPSYLSVYLGDKITWKMIDVSIGLRVDNFNANQPVLKDPFLFYPAYTVGEMPLVDVGSNTTASHPDNMGDEYVIYVDHAESPTEITGYRNEDTWYDADGNEINDPYLLDRGSGVTPLLVDPGQEQVNSNAFEDFKAVTNFLPQINIDMKTRFGNAYAYYNSFSRNPSYFNIFRPDQYYFINTVGGLLNNPDLKPLGISKLSIGIKPVIYKNLYAEVGYLGVFIKNYFYTARLFGAYPRDYTTILNYDKVIPNHNLIISLNYFSPKSSGFGAGSSFTKSFISDQDNVLLMISDFVLNTHATFNFGYGRDFILSGNKALRAIFENFGIGVYHQFRTGTKLPVKSYVEPEYLNSPNFCFYNLRVEKGFYIKPAGITASLYLWIENLFNKQNLFYIDPVTGKPDDDGYLSAPEWQNEINSQTNPDTYRMLYQYKLSNPAYYDTPRIIRLGLIVKI